MFFLPLQLVFFFQILQFTVCFDEAKPTILFCADNLYHSHFKFAEQQANIIVASDRYKLHLLVADHFPEKHDSYVGLDRRIVLIRVPVDYEHFLKPEFLDKVPKGAFSNWAHEVNTFDKPDFWARFSTYTIALYQAVVTNQRVTIKNLQTKSRHRRNILDWLRRMMSSPTPYALGITEYGVSASGLTLFQELGIQRTLANSAATPLPAFYHFLGMSIPVGIPEFFAAQPKDVQFSKKNNREAYEKEIVEVKKVFFDDNLNVLKKIRQNASERGIKLREVEPLSSLLGKCHSFLINQLPGVDFKWPKDQQLEQFFKFIGGINIRPEVQKLFAEKFIVADSQGPSIINPSQKNMISMIGGTKQWMPEADCVVLFSMGTIVNFMGFTPTATEAMLKAFGKEEKCTFLVRFDRKIMKKLSKRRDRRRFRVPKNVQIQHYTELIAQQEILAQKNVRALITHCGQNSLNEALFAGVPVICMPFFYDQPYNASIIEHLNVGIWVKPQEFVTKFPNALKEILHNDKYRLNALNIGKSVHAKKTPDEVLLDTVHEVLMANDHPMSLVTERTEIEFIDD